MQLSWWVWTVVARCSLERTLNKRRGQSSSEHIQLLCICIYSLTGSGGRSCSVAPPSLSHQQLMNLYLLKTIHQVLNYHAHPQCLPLTLWAWRKLIIPQALQTTPRVPRTTVVRLYPPTVTRGRGDTSPRTASGPLDGTGSSWYSLYAHSESHDTTLCHSSTSVHSLCSWPSLSCTGLVSSAQSRERAYLTDMLRALVVSCLVLL